VQGELLILTLIPLAEVAPQTLLLGLFRLLSSSLLKLQAVAPTCTTLIDPP
jgi:hypothetical protein